MKIDTEKCIGCGQCQAYCPMGAIIEGLFEKNTVSEVVQEECVECGVCLKSAVCPTDALYMPEIDWPRRVRIEFSNPLVPHSRSLDQRIGGRGTEEMKTNDVTGRFPRGTAGVVIEMGRPGLGATFREMQEVTTELAKLGVTFEASNPVTLLMIDSSTGIISEEILDEKVLSAIIEFDVKIERLKEALEMVKEISTGVGTVFSLGVISRVDDDGTIPTLAIAKEAGFRPSENAKVNVGLGRPLFKEE